MFKLSKKSANGTSMQASTKSIKCIDLINTFGMPNTPSDDHKVSHEWNFEGPKGEVFTLYDYKATNLYDEELPSPEEFRVDPHGYQWHIGALNKSDVQGFTNWLYEQLYEQLI